MKILLASTPAAGHVNPLFGLTALAISRGVEVLVATGSRLEPRDKATNASFTPLLGAADIISAALRKLYRNGVRCLLDLSR